MSAVGSMRDAPALDVRHVFISYKRSAEPDTYLASFLYEALTEAGSSRLQGRRQHRRRRPAPGVDRRRDHKQRLLHRPGGEGSR